jgi:hypothetical protein
MDTVLLRRRQGEEAWTGLAKGFFTVRGTVRLRNAPNAESSAGHIRADTARLGF